MLVAEGQAQTSTVSVLMLVLPLVLLALLMISQRRRAKATEAAQAALQVGDHVQTTSGMFGVLRELNEQTGSLEVAPGVCITFDRRALLPAPHETAKKAEASE